MMTVSTEISPAPSKARMTQKKKNSQASKLPRVKVFGVTQHKNEVEVEIIGTDVRRVAGENGDELRNAEAEEGWRLTDWKSRVEYEIIFSRAEA